MALSNQISHHIIPQTNLKWQTYDSPASTDLMWQDGANILTTPRGYAERRPGFSTPLESNPTTFTGTIQRLYQWRRWDDPVSGDTRGHFFWMLCEVTSAGESKVWKLDLQTDASFSLLFTSGSSVPFDFIASNNYVYFGNGADMLKWDGTTLTKWGIEAPKIAPVATAGTAVSTAYTSRPSSYSQPQYYDYFRQPWAVWDGNLGIYCEMQVKNQTSGKWMETRWQGFSPVGGTVTAINLNINSYCQVGPSDPNTGVRVHYSTDGGNTWTLIYEFMESGVRNSTTDTVALDAATNLSLLVVRTTLQDTHTSACYMSIGEIWCDVTTTADMTATTGWYYCYTYGNSITGHESSPSPLSLDTGAQATKQMKVTVQASTDPQVNQIRIYRSPDGGDAVPDEMQEIIGSPFPNTSADIDDTTPDVALGLRYAPPFYRNDPPEPSTGFIRSEASGRIFGIDGNRVIYSGQEEIVFGVHEECFPGEMDGNYRSFSTNVHGLGDLTTGPMILCAERIVEVEGDTRDTFRWQKVADRQGTRATTAVCSFGGQAAFRDTSGSIYRSDGTDIGFAIRDQLAQISWSNPHLVPHIAGQRRWLCFLDGSTGTLYVYDIDQDQWMVPWTTGATAIYSGETDIGKFDLIAAIGGVLYKLTDGTYTDGASAYQAWAKLNLFPIAPEQKPDKVGKLAYLGIETGIVLPTTVKILTDDATTAAAGEWQDVSANAQTDPKRKQGTLLLSTQYPASYDQDYLARRCAFWLDWGTSATNFYLYGLDVAYYSTVQ